MSDELDHTRNAVLDLRTNRYVKPLPLPSADFAGLAQLRVQWTSMPMVPIVRMNREEGVDNSWDGFDVRTLLIGEESAGGFTVHDVIIAPGAALDAHHLLYTDSYWYVQAGEVEVQVGSRVDRIGKDGFAYIPEFTTQAIRNLSDAPARLFLWYSPAGPERAFALAHEEWLRAPASKTASRRALSAFGFVFHAQGERLPNDEMTNLSLPRLEADVEIFSDLANLRTEWAKRIPLPRCISSREGLGDIPMHGQYSKILLDGDESSGRCVVFDHLFDPEYRAPPHHQPSEEEMFMVVEGALRLTVGNVTADVPAGGFGFIPRYATHGFVNASGKLAKSVNLNAPAGHERGFEMIIREAASDAFADLLVAHGWRLHEAPDEYQESQQSPAA